MTSDLDLRERRELCDLFDEVGPDAPTLCGDWTTADLAAHLVVRERDPRSGPGILLGGRFERYTESLMARELERHGFAGVVQRVRTGPPVGPFRIRPIGHAANIVEFFVHHEDVRRARGDRIRADRTDLDEELWGMLKRLLPLMVRKARIPNVELIVERPDGARRSAGSGEAVVMSGAVQDLVLELYGRSSVVEVDVSGDRSAVARVTSATFGI